MLRSRQPFIVTFHFVSFSSHNFRLEGFISMNILYIKRKLLPPLPGFYSKWKYTPSFYFFLFLHHWSWRVFNHVYRFIPLVFSDWSLSHSSTFWVFLEHIKPLFFLSFTNELLKNHLPEPFFFNCFCVLRHWGSYITSRSRSADKLA